MSTYEVNATLIGSVWNVEVPAIGRVTQALHARDITAMATELIEIMTGEESPEIAIAYALPAGAGEHLRKADELRTVESDARRQAAIEVRLAAVALKDQGLTLRDIGAVLGISHQRAAQLIEA